MKSWMQPLIDYYDSFLHNNQLTEEQIKERLRNQNLAYTVNGDNIIHYKNLTVHKQEDVPLSLKIKVQLRKMYLEKSKIYISKQHLNN